MSRSWWVAHGGPPFETLLLGCCSAAAAYPTSVLQTLPAVFIAASAVVVPEPPVSPTLSSDEGNKEREREREREREAVGEGGAFYVVLPAFCPDRRPCVLTPLSATCTPYCPPNQLTPYPTPPPQIRHRFPQPSEPVDALDTRGFPGGVPQASVGSEAAHAQALLWQSVRRRCAAQPGLW